MPTAQRASITATISASAESVFSAAARAVAKKESKAGAEKIRIEQHSVSGLLWLVGWLYTIGFLHLPFWKGAFALLVWPYYIGTAISALMAG